MVSRARLGSLGLTESGNLYANTVVTTDIQDGAITGGKIAANTITANNIQAGAITLSLLGNIYTSNIIENGNTTSGNVYFSNARSIRALTAGDGVVIEGNGRISANLSAANITVTTSNIYNTGIQIGVEANVTGNVKVTDTVFTNKIQANVWNNLYTSNVIESGNTTTGNVYFTNTRAVGALTGGTGITIAANGLIVGTSSFSGNTNLVPEGSANLYFTNARAISALTAGKNILLAANGLISVVSITSNVFVSDGANVTFNIVRTIASPADLLVFVNGLCQIPTTDYTVSSNVLTLTSPAPANANIEIRFLSNS